MHKIILTAAALLAPVAAHAQSNPTTVTPINFAGSYTQNFDTLASSGSTGTSLPQGFQIVEAGTNANSSYAVGSGSSNAGGSYSFGSTGSTDRALGSLGSGTLAPIYFGGVLTNTLSSTLTSLTFAYTGEQWRLGNSTDDGLVFQYRIGATGVNGGTWTTVSALAFAPLFTNGTSTGSALDGNLAANQRQIGATISGFSLLAGQNFGFRWFDEDSTGADQGLGVDNLTITSAVTAAVPESSTWAMLIAGFGLTGAALRRRSARVALA